MFALTRQEKTAVVFLAGVMMCGSVLLLIRNNHPAVMEVLAPPSPKRFYLKVNIHSAGVEEWESLPGIGAYRAARIVAARQERGGFRSIEDVRYVKGIGPYVFNQIRDRLTDE